MTKILTIYKAQYELNNGHMNNIKNKSHSVTDKQHKITQHSTAQPGKGGGGGGGGRKSVKIPLQITVKGRIF